MTTRATMVQTSTSATVYGLDRHVAPPMFGVEPSSNTRVTKSHITQPDVDHNGSHDGTIPEHEYRHKVTTVTYAVGARHICEEP